MPDASGDCFLWPGPVGTGQRDSRRACKRDCKFFDCDRPTNHDGTKQSLADRLCAEKQSLTRMLKISYYHALRAAAAELTSIAKAREPRPQEVDKFREALQIAGRHLASR